MHRRQLVQEEEDEELNYLVTCLHNTSAHNYAYLELFKQCTRRFPDLASRLCKPEYVQGFSPLAVPPPPLP
jgi:hypothetical protein